MSGILRRIRGARAAAPDPAPDQGAGWSTGDTTVHVHDETAHAGGPSAVPAGVDLDALVGDRPTARRRGALRRRLRHLRRVREVLLRDLGGLVFEVHRSGLGGDLAGQQVVAGKLARLRAVDAELRELEALLDDRRGMVLREPGIGGACPACGELFGSDARFCWACGTPVAPGAALAAPAPAATAPAEGAAGVPAAQPAPEPAVAAQPAPVPPPVDPAPEARPGSGEAPTAVLRPGDPLMDRHP